MAVYMVMSPPDTAAQSSHRPKSKSPRFIRDGFHWLALLFPLLWMLFNRMWLIFIISIAGLIIMQTALSAFPVMPSVIIVALFSIFIALEAGALKAWSLKRKNWSVIDIVSGSNLEEAEARFFSRWANSPDINREMPIGSGSSTKSQPKMSKNSVIGLTLDP
ncbi:DUF2628 domain-containing protein [Flexibacterium corallicola]|uniref:DUF2628 domain-containing protein n=1 Tax=Flexibacterium corallicola TaxID=3037259 RepID=UPI00286F9C16|nr:DUF2628 domain-containing protein [Pseudovibrio sp. M1P-2-3]